MKGSVCAVLTLILATPVIAEVAVIPGGGNGVSAILEMHDRDLAPLRIWSPVRPGGARPSYLNPDGDFYQDGPPSIVINPVTRQPEAVWSYWDGNHYQVAWSRFNGNVWTMVQTPLGPDYQYLTADDRQNFDPKLWIDQVGNRRVVWWRRAQGEPDDVVITVLPAGETQWWSPQRVSRDGVSTRRADTRTFPLYGTFIVAEEDTSGNLSLVIFDSPLLDGHVPQRGSDPWGRTLLRISGPSTSLSPSIVARPTPADGDLPVALWREGTLLAVSAYDPEAGVWAEPVFTTMPVW